MGELVNRAEDVVAKTAGGTAGSVVAALLVAAAAATNSPDLAAWSVPAGAATGAIAEQGSRVIAERIRNAAERITRFVDAVTDEAGQPMEDFIDEHMVDANSREFLGRVVDAATAARSDWKVRVLARAFVRGAKDGDRIDETEMFVAAIRDLEPPHARFLAAAERLFRDSPGRFAATVDLLQDLDKGLGPSAALLWRHLRDRGLMVEMEPATGNRGADHFRLTDLGWAVAEWLRELGAPAPGDLEGAGATASRQGASGG
ncbi:hypothetical protein [Micromonospora sp. 067-2]|uniref:hypothetical protein n=1 Tax=Micromonospora sp. 067-2 TaxID=2789270 RepID=UPI00397AD0B4